MPIRPRGVAAVIALGLLSGVGSALAGPWTHVPVVPAGVQELPKFVRSAAGSVFRIDWPRLEAELTSAPLEDRAARASVVVALPLPDGRGSLYGMVESPIMEPGLAARFPEFRTYRVEGIDDPSAVGRIDVTTHGLRAMIRTDAGTIFIDPYAAGSREYASVYYLHEFVEGDAVWTCHTGEVHGALPTPAAPGPHDPAFFQPGPQDRGNLPIRTYRMAMACTGEYGAYQSQVLGHAPNVTDALGAIVTVVNRSNVTFEADLGVRFLLVSNNNLIAFFDPATDPYADPDPTCTSDPAADCSSPYLSANPAAINNAIGSTNYDVGHVLTRVRGGVASLRSVCSSTNKARGVSGIPRGGEDEPISALVVLHELGHQFGANHTFNGVLGRCNANINGATNWEPGGGSTLLAYPGACPVGGTIGQGDTDNLVLFADPYFHSGSLIEMRSFLAGASSQCSQSVATGNGAPVILSTSPDDRSIPPQTPFELTADVSDDSPSLVYCWEQMDIGPAQTLVGPESADNGDSALFRSFPPTAGPTRTFPRWSDLLAGANYIGERMPTYVGVTRKFMVTVRDNQGASVTSGLIRVNLAASAPFAILEPAEGAIVRTGMPFSIAWEVGATASAPISTATVSIDLSLDGDEVFETPLVAGAPNVGTYTGVLAPTAPTSQARVRVRADGNHYFAVSRPFDVSPPCDSIDFNIDEVFPDSEDLFAFLLVFGGGSCPGPSGCADIDFNNDGVEPDTQDLLDFLRVFGGGPC